MILRILPKQITALQSIFHFSPSVRGSTFHMLQHIGIYNRDQRDSRFSRILENFHFLVSISKHFDFTFHFSEKSESIFFHFAFLEKEWKHFFSLCTSRKRVKAFCFHFSLLELQKSTLAGPCYERVDGRKLLLLLHIKMFSWSPGWLWWFST